MTRVDFYVLSENAPDARLRHACRIAELAVERGNRVYLQTATSDETRRLDDLLWTYNDRSFLPHEIAGGPPSHPRVMVMLGESAPPDYGERAEAETLTLELGEMSRLKLAAISRHISQTGSAGPFHDWSAEMRDGYLATEHYRLAASNLPVPAGSGATEPEQSIWDGLP